MNVGDFADSLAQGVKTIFEKPPLAAALFVVVLMAVLLTGRFRKDEGN